MKPSELEIAWAAGFFDGEGCIMTGKSGANRMLRVKVPQNDRRPLDALRSWFGGHIWHETNVRQDRFVWTIQCKQARAFLAAVEPYLFVKGERTRLALSVHPNELQKIASR